MIIYLKSATYSFNQKERIETYVKRLSLAGYKPQIYNSKGIPLCKLIDDYMTIKITVKNDLKEILKLSEALQNQLIFELENSSIKQLSFLIYDEYIE